MGLAEMARDNRTDERLDDLNHRVDEGFRETREEFRAVRSELRDMRAEMAASRRTVVQAAGAIWVTSMVGFLGVIATILATQ